MRGVAGDGGSDRFDSGGMAGDGSGEGRCFSDG